MNVSERLDRIEKEINEKLREIETRVHNIECVIIGYEGITRDILPIEMQNDLAGMMNSFFEASSSFEGWDNSPGFVSKNDLMGKEG